jgi:transcription termination/antitermination protein NusA
MSSKEIRLVVDAVSHEKDISQKVIFEALEIALVQASKKRYGSHKDFRVEIDPQTGEHRTFRRWLVVASAEGEDSETDSQMDITVACTRHPEAQVGHYVEEEVESVAFGRIEAQAAKQVIIQCLRAAKREQMIEEYKNREGELVTGVVKRVTRDYILVELPNNAEAILPRSQILPREIFRINDRVRAYLQIVHEEGRDPQLMFSRTAKEMIIALFKIEVPEIGDGQIDIKAAARDPGSRAKIAVQAKDTRLDPIGACVGMRGARVQAVSSELGGERVDIVLWNESPAQFVINALAPAEVVSILMDEDTRMMDVVVENEQLSQAIGRNGQNVRLASQLTGWELHIISEEQAAERQKSEENLIIKNFATQLQMEEEVAEAFIAAGFGSVSDVAYAETEELLAIPGLEGELLLQWRQKATDALLTQAIVTEDCRETLGDLLAIKGMDESTALQLSSVLGLTSRESLAEQAVDDLLVIEGLLPERAAQLIMSARAPWFMGSSESH